MASVNKVILIGHLGRDPEIRYTPAGDAVANLALATSDTWKDKTTGEKKQHTEWHRVVFFGPTAEVCGKWLHKGSQIYVEGSLRTRKYIDKDEIERYATEIRGDSMKMLGSKLEEHASSAAEPANESTPPASAPSAKNDPVKPAAPAAAKPNFSDFDDDIPF